MEQNRRNAMRMALVVSVALAGGIALLLLTQTTRAAQDPVTTIELYGLQKNVGGVSSRYVVTNTGDALATTMHGFYDGADAVVHQLTDIVEPSEGTIYDLATIDALPDGYTGYVIISADQPITGTVLESDVELPEQTVSFDPSGIGATFSNSADVEIRVDAAGLKAGQMRITYGATCADAVGWTRNTTAFPSGTWESETVGEEWITFMAPEAVTGTFTIGTLSVRCTSESTCSSALNFSVSGDEDSVLFDAAGRALPTTWNDGTFECIPGTAGDVAGGDGTVNMGDVSLLHSYVGHPGDYELCCDWCGDVAPCPESDGVIDMGDVSLLHSYVGYPGDYTLCSSGESGSTSLTAPAATAAEVSTVPAEGYALTGRTAEMGIQVSASGFKAGQVPLTYDMACAEVTGWTPDSTTFPYGTWETVAPGESWITFYASDAITGTYTVGSLTIECRSQEPCTTPLHFVTDGVYPSKLFDDWGGAIEASWMDGVFGRAWGVYVPVVLKEYAD